MTAVETRTLEHCLACGSRSIASAAMRYEWQGTRFPAAECRDCGMLFLRVQPVGESLARMYSAEYFAEDFRCGRIDAHSTDESAFRAENDGLLDRFEPWRGANRLLEVGCASGLLLKRARERGWEATGVELSPDAVAHARSLGLDVHQGTLDDAALPAEAFDIVYMGDVLEHVPDCHATLAEVARVLEPGGHAIIRGPITTHSLARRLGLALYGALGREIVLREPPYHLWEFRPSSLRRLAERVGLEVVALEQSKIPPGRPHGAKSALQATAMRAIDTLNAPLTAIFHVFGDRAVLVARKPLARKPS
jgi:2-polyprenyl-3-methyl-5-hydroxy-6-metoxy-1,4-benzoquinol methylase